MIECMDSIDFGAQCGHSSRPDVSIWSFEPTVGITIPRACYVIPLRDGIVDIQATPP